jgi:MerR family copper efflux transcriptional regulator
VDRDSFSSSEVLQITGVSRKALRLYESRGLLTRPVRTYTGRLRYSVKTIEEVRFIRAAVRAGIQLKDLKPALDEWRQGKSACPSLTKVIKRRADELADQIRVLQLQQEQIQSLIQEWNLDCPVAEGVCVQITGLARS